MQGTRMNGAVVEMPQAPSQEAEAVFWGSQLNLAERKWECSQLFFKYIFESYFAIRPSSSISLWYELVEAWRQVTIITQIHQCIQINVWSLHSFETWNIVLVLYCMLSRKKEVSMRLTLYRFTVAFACHCHI